jgi:hypothetical protein
MQASTIGKLGAGMIHGTAAGKRIFEANCVIKKVGEYMGSEDFKAIPYTIEIDWNGGTVWLNNHVSKEKIVITEKDSKSISSAFKLLEAKKKGLI